MGDHIANPRGVQTATSGTPKVPLVAAGDVLQERATKKNKRGHGATSGKSADPLVAAGGITEGRKSPPEEERHRGGPPFRMKGIEWRRVGRYWYALSRHWVLDPKTGKKKRKRRYLGRLDK